MGLKLFKQTDNNTLIYKEYDNGEFITKGYDYWFLGYISVEKAAAIATLDFLTSQPSSGILFNSVPYQAMYTIDLEQIEGGELYLNSSSCDLAKIVDTIKEKRAKPNDAESESNQEEEKDTQNQEAFHPVVPFYMYRENIVGELQQKKQLCYKYPLLYFPGQPYDVVRETVDVKDDSVTFGKRIKPGCGNNTMSILV